MRRMSELLVKSCDKHLEQHVNPPSRDELLVNAAFLLVLDLDGPTRETALTLLVMEQHRFGALGTSKESVHLGIQWNYVRNTANNLVDVKNKYDLHLVGILLREKKQSVVAIHEHLDFPPHNCHFF